MAYLTVPMLRNYVSRCSGSLLTDDTEENSSLISFLPLELLSHIFYFCDLRSYRNLASQSRYTFNAATNDLVLTLYCGKKCEEPSYGEYGTYLKSPFHNYLVGRPTRECIVKYGGERPFVGITYENRFYPGANDPSTYPTVPQDETPFLLLSNLDPADMKRDKGGNIPCKDMGFYVTHNLYFLPDRKVLIDFRAMKKNIIISGSRAHVIPFPVADPERIPLRIVNESCVMDYENSKYEYDIYYALDDGEETIRNGAGWRWVKTDLGDYSLFGHYLDGKEVGMWSSRSGLPIMHVGVRNPSALFTLINGEVTGPFRLKDYYKLTEGNMRKGKLHGEITIRAEPYSNKKVVKTYKDGVLDGLFRIENGRGVIQEEGEYRDGLRVGLWKRYHSDGRLKCCGYYRYGANGKRYSGYRNGWEYYW